MFTPKVSDLVFDSNGCKLLVVYVTNNGNSVATVSDNDIYVYEKFANGRYRDQEDESVFLIGPATQAVWDRFQQSQEIEND